MPQIETYTATQTITAVLSCDAHERWYRNNISSNAEANSSDTTNDTNSFTHTDRKIRRMRHRMKHSSRGRVYYAPKSSMPLVNNLIHKNWTRTYTVSSALRTSNWNGFVDSTNKMQSSQTTPELTTHSMLYVLTYDLPVNTRTTNDLSILKTHYSIDSSIAVWIDGVWTYSDVIQQRVSPRRSRTPPASDSIKSTDIINLYTLWLSSLVSLIQSRSIPLYSTRCCLEDTRRSSTC